LDFKIPKSGYFFVFLTNETNDKYTFFDNLVVQHYTGPLSETNDYTAWGLSIKMLESKAVGRVENRYKYNGKELQSKEFSDGSGLELYDLNARMYDQQIGHFPCMDPLAESFASRTIYNYSFDNPVRFGDPTGMSGTDWVKKDNTWTYNENIKTSEQSKAAGYDDFVENGSTIENARIGKDGRFGAVYLGNSSSDVAYSENNFTNWNAIHGSEYDNQAEAHRAWQSDPNYHIGEGKWDKIFRGMAYASMEARRDYASGGMNMYNGYGSLAQGATAVEGEANAFFGVRELSLTLRTQGLIRTQRLEIINAFEKETITSNIAGSKTYGLRFFDNDNAQAQGRWLFTTFTKYTNRSGLALPNNQMTSFTQWQLKPGTIYFMGRVASQGAGLEGGATQMFVLNISNLLIPK
jgi:RHS repeat-associated protein